MAESPFLASANTNTTTTQGSIWTVLVQPSFVDLVSEASALVTRGVAHQGPLAPGATKPAHQPSEFAIRIKQAAKAAVGGHSSGVEKEETDDAELYANEEAQETKEQETEESKEVKRKIVEEVWTKVQPSCLSKIDDRELEATINLLITLLLSFFPPTHPKFFDFVLQLLEAIVTAEGKTSSYGRYSAMFTLFNALPAPTTTSETRPPLQLTIFSRLADMSAGHPEDLPILLPSLLRLPSYLTQWGLVSSKFGVDTIGKVARVCEQGGKHMDAFNLCVVYLSSPELASPGHCIEVDSVAEICVRLALTLPDCYDWDLLDDIPPVSRYLNSTKNGQDRYKDLITLLKCPATKFDQIEQKLNSNAQLGTMLTDDIKQRIQRKARLLSLTELCGGRVGGEVGYGEVKECLGLTTSIEEDDGMEVEEWIINAVKSKLITARLHQPSQMIYITKAAFRSFGLAQWQLLHSRLRDWGSSIDHLINVLEQSLPSIDSYRQASGNDGNRQGFGKN